jgi:hypothetical protein
MKEVIAAIGVVFLVLIPGSAFAYWVPDSYGQGVGPGLGLPGPQGGYLGDNPGLSLPWLGNRDSLIDPKGATSACRRWRS